MYKSMRIVWDDPKRRANLVKHGLDFADLDLAFFDVAIFRPAHSGRLQAIGWIDGALLVSVVFRLLGSEAISLISLRTASARERELYEDGL